MPPTKRGRANEDDEGDGGSAGHGGRDDDAEGSSSKRTRQDEVVEDGMGSEDSDVENECEEGVDQSEEDQEAEGFSYLEKVEIDNFMGLNKYSVMLKRNINLISGKNGSGKSTVLCAISIALGGDAKGTERASKLEELVGTFGDKAVVKVHIRLNDADSRQKWGDKVIVERTLSKGSGATSSFKLIRIDGDRKSTVWTKKQDLTNLCDNLNYQILPLNPVQILHQKVAKTFFTEGSAEQFYNFFSRCTRLEQFQTEVLGIQEYRKTLVAREAHDERNLDIFLETEYERARRDFEETKKLRALESEQKKVSVEYAWSIVEEKEAAVKSFTDKDVAKAAKALSKAKQTLQEEQVKGGDIDNSKKALEEELSKVRLRATDLATTVSDAEKEEKSAKAQLGELEREIQRKTRFIEDLRQKISEHRRNIENQKREAQAKNVRRGRNKDLPSVVELEAKLTELEAKLRVKEEQKGLLQGQIEVLNEDLEQKQRAHKRIEFDVSKARADVDHWERCQRDSERTSLNKLGREVCRIKELLEARKEAFRGHFPIGPLGAFIKVKEARWGRAVADCIGQGSQTWLVKGKREQDLCMQILQDAQGSGRLESLRDFKCSYANPDEFEPARSSSRHPNVMEVIDIDHPDEAARLVIRNHLVDHCRANEVHLFDNYRDAVAHIRKPAESVRLANGVTIKLRQQALDVASGRKHTKKGETEISHPIQANNIFGTDCTEDLQHSQRKLQDLRAREMDAAAEVTAQQENKRKLDVQIRAVMGELKALGSERRALMEEVGRARVREEEEDIAVTADTSFDENEIIEKEAQIAMQEAELMEREGKVEAAVAKHKAARGVVDSLRAEARTVKALLDEKTTAMQDLRDTAENRRTTEDLLKTLIAKRESELAAKQTQLKALEAALQLAVSDSRPYEPRVPVTRSSHDLEQALKEILNLIKRKEREMGKDAATVDKNWKVCEINKMKKERDLKELKALTEDYTLSVMSRVKSFKKMRHRKGGLIQTQFVKYLQNRGFMGSLDIDHKQRILLPKVTTEHKGGGASQTVPVSQLSGGERSYTMLSFIMALSNESSSPLLALDEFDVFMDERNRSLGLDMLIKSLRDRPEMQCIIISPLTMRDVRDAPDVHKLVMRDPDRSQRVLDS